MRRKTTEGYNSIKTITARNQPGEAETARVLITGETGGEARLHEALSLLLRDRSIDHHRNIPTNAISPQFLPGRKEKRKPIPQALFTNSFGGRKKEEMTANQITFRLLRFIGSCDRAHTRETSFSADGNSICG